MCTTPRCFIACACARAPDDDYTSCMRSSSGAFVYMCVCVCTYVMESIFFANAGEKIPARDDHRVG